MKNALIGLLLAGTPMLCTPVVAQDRYPSKPVVIIVPVAPGGSTDPPLRLVADMAGEMLGVSVVVENVPGGGSIIGTTRAARSRPDGYTLFNAGSGNMVTAPAQQKVPYDVEKDFTFIARLLTLSNSVVVTADSPFKTWKDLTDFARANPGRLRWASSGAGTTSHMIGEATFRQLNLRTVTLPTNGAAEAMLSLLGKHVEVAMMGGWYPNYAAGQVRVLAETGPIKIPGMPNIPTFRELGYAVSLTTFVGLGGPAGIAPEIVARWEKILPEILNSSRFKDYFEKTKQIPAPLNSRDFRANVIAEYRTAVGLAKELGLERK